MATYILICNTCNWHTQRATTDSAAKYLASSHERAFAEPHVVSITTLERPKEKQSCRS